MPKSAASTITTAAAPVASTAVASAGLDSKDQKKTATAVNDLTSDMQQLTLTAPTTTALAAVREKIDELIGCAMGGGDNPIEHCTEALRLLGTQIPPDQRTEDDGFSERTCYFLMSRAYFDDENFPEALKFIQKSLAMSFNKDMPYQLSLNYKLAGDIYFHLMSQTGVDEKLKLTYRITAIRHFEKAIANALIETTHVSDVFFSFSKLLKLLEGSNSLNKQFYKFACNVFNGDCPKYVHPLTKEAEDKCNNAAADFKKIYTEIFNHSDWQSSTDRFSLSSCLLFFMAALIEDVKGQKVGFQPNYFLINLLHCSEEYSSANPEGVGEVFDFFEEQCEDLEAQKAQFELGCTTKKLTAGVASGGSVTSGDSKDEKTKVVVSRNDPSHGGSATAAANTGTAAAVAASSPFCQERPVSSSNSSIAAAASSAAAVTASAVPRAKP